MSLMPRADWSRRLPEPIVVSPRRKLRTLLDVSKFLLALPPERHATPGCQYLAALAIKAAEGRADVAAIPVVFKIARLR
jgi:hypothetical protein